MERPRITAMTEMSPANDRDTAASAARGASQFLKHEREDTLEAREVPTRARVEIAGELGDKRFLIRLEELVENRPFDVVNLELKVPTVKGARQTALLHELRGHVRAAGGRAAAPRDREGPRPRRRVGPRLGHGRRMSLGLTELGRYIIVYLR